MSTQSAEHPKLELPKVLRVNTGTIHISTNNEECDTIKEFETYQRELTHLLSLIPDEHKATAERDDDGFNIETDCLPALKYATDKYFLCSYCSTINAVVDHFAEEVCDDCMDDLVEEALELNYLAQVLSDGVYLTREAC